MGNFDMRRAIENLEMDKEPGEMVAFAIGAGRIIPALGKRKQMEAALELIKRLEGFLGVHPVDLWHTLLIFDELNNAKGARNIMLDHGIKVGEVIPILIPEEFAGNPSAAEQ